MLFMIFFTTLAVCYSLYLVLSPEDDSIISSKRLGAVMVVIFLMTQMVFLAIQNEKYNTLFELTQENNITLPSDFNKEVKQYKIDRYSKSLSSKSLSSD